MIELSGSNLPVGVAEIQDLGQAIDIGAEFRIPIPAMARGGVASFR